MKQACIICDIDGVYMDSTEWDKYVPEKHNDRKGWDNFAKHINACKPNPPIIKLITTLSTVFPIIFLTSREDANGTREATIEQIKKFSNNKIDLLNSKHKLLMRRYEDYRRSFIVKEEILKNDILPFYFPIIAIDDDKGNIDMFRKNNIGTIYYTNLREGAKG